MVHCDRQSWAMEGQEHHSSLSSISTASIYTGLKVHLFWECRALLYTTGLLMEILWVVAKANEWLKQCKVLLENDPGVRNPLSSYKPIRGSLPFRAIPGKAPLLLASPVPLTPKMPVPDRDWQGKKSRQGILRSNCSHWSCRCT